jgi:glucan 1,3-beta-glucosidase
MGYESSVPTTFSTRASTAKSLSTTAAESTGTKSIIYTPSTAASAPSSSASASSSWVSLGCYTDDVAGRAMKGYPVPGGAQAMTIESCQATCLGLGYTLAGLEYADDCCKLPFSLTRIFYFKNKLLLIIEIDCGDTIKGNNGPAPDGNAKCNMKCLGNPNEICGGPNRMNLYSHNASASTSSPASVKEVSTREQTSTSMAAGVTGIGDSAWHYRGCYTDCGAGTLAHGNPTSDTMTVAKCQAMCLAQGYCLAGLE